MEGAAASSGVCSGSTAASASVSAVARMGRMAMRCGRATDLTLRASTQAEAEFVSWLAMHASQVPEKASPATSSLWNGPNTMCRPRDRCFRQPRAMIWLTHHHSLASRHSRQADV